MARPLHFLIALAAAFILSACRDAAPVGTRAALEGERAQLEKAIARDDDAIAERIRLARVTIALDDGVAAEATLRAALRAGARADALRPLLAQALVKQGERGRAREVLREGPVSAAMEGEAAWIAANLDRDDGQLASARAHYDRALTSFPDDASLWLDIARFRLASADAHGARAAADHAISLDPRHADALIFRGTLKRLHSGVDAALRDFDAAAVLDPGHRELWYARAATLGDAGRYKAMLAALRRAAEIAPRDPRLFYFQAVLAARAGNYPLARSLLQRTRGAMDDVPGFMLVNAITELELGGEAVAVSWAERLVAAQPHNFAARRLLAAASWADGDTNGARDAIAPIVVRDDADSWSLLLAARIENERGNVDAGDRLLARAAALAPGEAGPYPAMGGAAVAALTADAAPDDARRVIPAIRAEIAEGQADRALERAVRLRDANPGVAAAHLLVGDAALAAGNIRAAVASYREAARIAPTAASALRLSHALFRAGDRAGSGRTLAAWLRRDPTNIEAHRAAGHLALDRGDWDSTIRHFEHIRGRLGDRDAVLFYALARAYRGRGDKVRAFAHAGRAYRLQPLNAELMGFYADLLDERGQALQAKDLREKAAQIGR